MPKSPQFDYRKTPKGWLVNIPSSVSDTGRFRRRYFKTRDKAKDEAQRLREVHEGTRQKAIDIPAALAEQAIAAAKLLEPFGISILEAASRVAGVETANLSSATMEAATADFSASKEGRSDAQQRLYRYMVRDLLADFAGRMVAGISGVELLTHVERRTNTPATFNSRCKLLRAFWTWCAKPPREWCDGRAANHLERKETTTGEISVLTSGEFAKLLSTAEKHFPDCVPGLAIAAFTGIRQAELERLQPEDITPEGITVPAVSAKTGRRRFIAMPSPLAAWLADYPLAATILPTNWERKERAIRRLAGWRVWSDLVKDPEPPANLPEWPKNALRHTAASVAVATGKPIETLVFEHGHSGGLQVLRNHYVGRMPRKEALAILATGPNGTKLQTIKAA